ncbi:hypothetical protein MASR2M78_30320 [Treponema sp.]
MEFHLSLRRKEDGSLVLSFPLLARLIIILVGLALIAASLIPEEAGAPLRGLGIGGYIVLIIVALASLYEERWLLDPARQELRFRFGLFFLARSVVLPFEEIEGIELERFYKGKAPGTDNTKAANKNASVLPGSTGAAGTLSHSFGLGRIFQPKPYLNLVLHLHNDLRKSNRLIVESVKEKQGGRLWETGKAFADCLGLELRV